MEESQDAAKAALSNEELLELHSMLRTCMEFFAGSHDRIEADCLKLCEVMNMNPLEVLFKPDPQLTSLLELSDAQTMLSFDGADSMTIKKVIHGFLRGIGIRAFVKSLAILCSGEVYGQIAAGQPNSSVRYLDNLAIAIPGVQEIVKHCKPEFVEEFVNATSSRWLNLETVRADINSNDKPTRDAAFQRAAIQIGGMVALCPVGLVPAE